MPVLEALVQGTFSFLDHAEQDDVCLMCLQSQSPSVEHHRLWTCPWMLSQLQRPVPADWHAFNQRDSDQHCFWHQLLVPAEFTSLLTQTPEQDVVEGVFEVTPVCVECVEDLKPGTDGSGGPHTSDPRLRQCTVRP